MSAFGMEIFEDDLALEVQTTYKKIYQSTNKTTEATENILKKFSFIKEREDDFSIFWLSLADIQMKLGHLEPKVKEKALFIIENGIDLARWEEDKDLLFVRRDILNSFKNKLLTS